MLTTPKPKKDETSQKREGESKQREQPGRPLGQT
jgi:hypothetical protein